MINVPFVNLGLQYKSIRKKILKKFGDDNFIKNNNKGYYIWKKNHEILLLEIYFHQNIKNVLLNLKKVKGAIKEKKVNLT